MPRRRLPPKPPRINRELPPDANQRLTPREARFVAEYVVSHDQFRSYRAAYPGCSHSTANAGSSAIMNRPHVAREIAAIHDTYAHQLQVSAERALRELAAIAHSDPANVTDENDNCLPLRKIPQHTRRAISSVKFCETVLDEYTEGKGKNKRKCTVIRREGEYKFWNKAEAIKLLSSTLGLKLESTPPLEVLLAALLTRLPTDQANELRAALTDKVPVPSTNGTHV